MAQARDAVRMALANVRGRQYGRDSLGGKAATLRFLFLLGPGVEGDFLLSSQRRENRGELEWERRGHQLGQMKARPFRPFRCRERTQGISMSLSAAE